MDTAFAILTELRRFCRHEPLHAEFLGFTWDHVTFLGTSLIRYEYGDTSVWAEFVERLRRDDRWARGVREHLIRCGILRVDDEDNRQGSELTPAGTMPLADNVAIEFLQVLDRAASWPQPPLQLPAKCRPSRTAILYIEEKPGIVGPARIGRVLYSKSRRTIYYRELAFRSLEGAGFKSNFCNQTGERYWISRCRRDGRDALYDTTVEIDEDVREEYWQVIRCRPDLVGCRAFTAVGKYRR